MYVLNPGAAGFGPGMYLRPFSRSTCPFGAERLCAAKDVITPVVLKFAVVVVYVKILLENSATEM
jgi:hypothetical protein